MNLRHSLSKFLYHNSDKILPSITWIETMKIGKLKITNPVFLAPMAGVTDYSFRILCKEQGAGMVYSEFVSAHGIIRKNEKTLNMIRFTEFERPIGIQIFGDDPEVMGQAARLAAYLSSSILRVSLTRISPVGDITRAM